MNKQDAIKNATVHAAYYTTKHLCVLTGADGCECTQL